MEMHEIVDQIDAQIAQLQTVRTLLAGTAAPIQRKPGRPSGSGKVMPPAKVSAVGVEKVTGEPSPVRTLSAEAPQRIAVAQKARWAKSRAATKKAAKKHVLKTEVAVAKHAKPKTVAAKAAPVKKAISAKKAAIGEVETAAVSAI